MLRKLGSRRRLGLASACLGLIALAACSGPAPAKDGAKPAADLTGAGATLPAPIYVRWGEDYAKAGNDKLNYQAIGSGAGVTQIVNRTVDFGASDSAVAAERLEKEGLLQFPAVIGAVVVIVNIPGVDGGELKLKADMIGDIYLGRLRMWDDPEIVALNPGLALPHVPISPTYRADSSGTTSIFTNFLSAVNPTFKERTGAANSVAWRTGLGAKGNGGVAAAVKNVKGGIGYVEYAYAAENKLQAPMISNKEGVFVRPTEEAFIAAAARTDWTSGKNMAVSMINLPGQTSWPIMTTTYVLVHRKPDNVVRTQRVFRYFDWAFRNGGGAAKQLHYIMLPPEVQEQVRAQWANLSVDGKPLWPVN